MDRAKPWILIGVLWIALAPGGVDAAPSRNVLVLYSADRLLPVNVDVDRALRETILNSAGRAVELYSEFLDRAHFGGEAYDASVAAYLQQKYLARPPDAIVAAGLDAVQFFLRNRARLFAGVPIVFVGISPAEVQSLGLLPPDVIGIPVQYDYAGTIDQALRLHPAATHLVLVTGANPLDRLDLARVHDATVHLDPRVTAEYLAGLPTQTVLEHLRTLGPESVVFTPGYFTDGDGRSFSPRESAQLIASASNAPVYGPFSTFIGIGVVGGRVPSYAAMASQAGTIVNTLLQGVAAQSLTLPTVLPSVLEIDWRQAHRFGIEARIPADAIVHFKEPTFWEAYGNVALAALAVMLLQAGLIGALLYGRRLQRRTESALEASERRVILAARTARLSNWVWSTAMHARANGTADNPPLRTPVSKEPTPVAFEDVLAATHAADRDALARAVRLACETEEELNVEYRVVEANHVRWFAVRGRAESGDPSLLRGVALDITQRKVAELQAEQDRAALSHMTRVSLLGQLSASIAHQLNQPLAAILGNAEAAQKMLSRPDVDLHEIRAICDDIVTEDNRAAQVIRRLGALYKHGERELRALDVNELIEETLELLRTDLVTRHVATTTELAADLPTIEGERVQLQQVLLNLIVNAADAMNGVAESARALRVRTEAVGDAVHVTVRDRGRGIAAGDLERIFDPFWSNKPGGMGIGLAICRSITTAHGGSLRAENNSDGGATFSVTLPAVASS